MDEPSAKKQKKECCCVHEQTHFVLNVLKAQRGYEDDASWESWYLPKQCPIDYAKIQESKNLSQEQKRLLLAMYAENGKPTLNSNADVCPEFDENQEYKELDNGLEVLVLSEESQAILDKQPKTFEFLRIMKLTRSIVCVCVTGNMFHKCSMARRVSTKPRVTHLNKCV